MKGKQKKFQNLPCPTCFKRRYFFIDAQKVGRVMGWKFWWWAKRVWLKDDWSSLSTSKPVSYPFKKRCALFFYYSLPYESDFFPENWINSIRFIRVSLSDRKLNLKVKAAVLWSHEIFKKPAGTLLSLPLEKNVSFRFRSSIQSRRTCTRSLFWIKLFDPEWMKKNCY